MTPTINLYNIDCMELLAKTPDKFYDLAIVDPEYGIGASKKTSYHSKGFQKYKAKTWDNLAAGPIFFSELFRVSKNQIIWGANYFVNHLPAAPKWIVWDKNQSDGIDQAMFELAYNSNNSVQAKILRLDFRHNKNNAIQKEKAKKYERIHPTQKPVALYKWLLQNYAKPGDKILDTHGGSFSHAIACYDLGFDLDICELDPDYFKAGKERFERHTRQGQLFTPNGQAKTEVIQQTIF